MGSDKKYKIAVASSDGENIDLGFGEAQDFIVYETDGKTYELKERRPYAPMPANQDGDCAGDNGTVAQGCRGGNGDHEGRIAVISDCKFVICARIGYGAQKALEMNGISAFDIEGRIDEAMDKMVEYVGKAGTNLVS